MIKKHTLSDEVIRKAKKEIIYETYVGKGGPLHEHNDCVRIAYEWLSAQKIVKSLQIPTYPLKHIIESWGGRYVSECDLDVAAHILGVPLVNRRIAISKRITLPCHSRLEHIGEAKTQWYSIRDAPRTYKLYEIQPGVLGDGMPSHTNIDKTTTNNQNLSDLK